MISTLHIRRILVTAGLCLLSVQGVKAQEVPIEIPLVAPGQLDSGFTRPESKAQWEAPQLACNLCRELPKNGSCGCEKPLTQALAQELYFEARRLAVAVGGKSLGLDGKIPVYVVSSAKLRQMGGEPVLGLYEKNAIWLSEDLDRRHGFAVLVHEYGHAWQYRNNPSVEKISDLRFEGFPEWLAYKVLTHLGDRSGANRIRNRDNSIYGRGARWYLNLEREHGLREVLRVARSAS